MSKLLQGASLSDLLNRHQLLLADGAAGTLLMAAGLPAGTPPDIWNIEQPEKILALHRAYIDAGTRVILTNTFGANRLKLEKAGYTGRVEAINRAGVALALQAADGRAFVAGDMGPTGELMAPMGPLTFELACQVFAEQAAVLAESGADALWIETMMDLEEARAAVTAARQVCDLPVLCTLSFRRKGRTMMGHSARQAAETLWPLGLAAIGANCGDGLEVVGEALSQMRQVLPEAPLIAKPNAGMPKMIQGETVYDVGPQDFAVRLQEFVGMGACLLGACCGSNPKFISAIDKLFNP